jgi:hypothetical protein
MPQKGRRSELVALEVADLSFEPEGVVLTIRRSKTDRDGAGASVAVPLGAEEGTCPVLALRRWLERAAIGAGRVFRRIDRHGNPRADVIGSGAGLEGDFAGHSLRAGFATAAARVGRSEAAIMRHGRWKSVQIARRCIRQAPAGTITPPPTSGSPHTICCEGARLQRRTEVQLMLSRASRCAARPGAKSGGRAAGGGNVAVAGPFLRCGFITNAAKKCFPKTARGVTGQRHGRDSRTIRDCPRS